MTSFLSLSKGEEAGVMTVMCADGWRICSFGWRWRWNVCPKLVRVSLKESVWRRVRVSSDDREEMKGAETVDGLRGKISSESVDACA